jgi:hypothetical protein
VPAQGVFHADLDPATATLDDLRERIVEKLVWTGLTFAPAANRSSLCICDGPIASPERLPFSIDVFEAGSRRVQRS